MKPILTKVCVICGTKFQTRAPKSKYCCTKCSRVAQKARESQGYVEKIKPKPKPSPIVDHKYKLWDFKDPECQEVYEFMKTIKPIF